MTITEELVRVPVETRSESNVREHWAVKAKRARQQRDATTLFLRTAVADVAPHIAGAALHPIRLVRVAPRGLDGDNLQGSMKAIRDAVAQWLFGGRTGQHDGMAQWVYEQRRGEPHEYAVEIWMPTFKVEKVAAC